MPFTGNENHDISLEDAKAMTKNYRDSQAGSTPKLGGFFGRAKIEAILAQPGCVGIRYYYGMDDAGQQTLILVGCDANEQDLVHGEIAEFSKPCPPRCGLSVLNS